MGVFVVEQHPQEDFVGITEIKELARQTTQATSSIKSEIESIQRSAAETVADIGRISEVIAEVDAIVSTIADAVGVQRGTTSEVVENLTQVSPGITEVNEKVAQSSNFSHRIADDFKEVNRFMGATSDHSQRVSNNAEKLTRLAADLKLMIGGFHVQQTSAAVEETIDTPDIIVWHDTFRFLLTRRILQIECLAVTISTIHGYSFRMGQSNHVK